MYCSVLSLGGNVNTRRMSKPEMGSIFHIKNRWNILVKWNYYVNYQSFLNLMLLSSSDTKRTLMHLFLFTNSNQRELVSICTQSIHDRNKLSLHYIIDLSHFNMCKRVENMHFLISSAKLSFHGAWIVLWDWRKHLKMWKLLMLITIHVYYRNNNNNNNKNWLCSSKSCNKRIVTENRL